MTPTQIALLVIAVLILIIVMVFLEYGGDA